MIFWSDLKLFDLHMHTVDILDEKRKISYMLLKPIVINAYFPSCCFIESEIVS